MSAGGSKKVIFTALSANLGIGVAKFIGAAISGSASLFAEGIHSMVDTTNQILLLIGHRAARQPPGRRHPLGHGRESFFWSFIVALLLFSMGGLFALYEGIHKLSEPEPLSTPWVGMTILFFAMAMEGFALHTCLKEIRADNPYGSLWVWFRRTTSAELLVIFTEDSAALLGLAAASICLGAAWWTGDPTWDAIGSMTIGLILIIVPFFLGMELKSLLIGEAPAEDYETAIDQIVASHLPGARLLNFIALQTGSSEVMVAYKIWPGETAEVELLIKRINTVERQVKSRFPEIKWQFVEPDFRE